MRTRNKALIITGVALMVVALIAFLLGGYFAGWDFAAFFKSATFVWICVLFGIYGLTAGAILIRDKINSI